MAITSAAVWEIRTTATAGNVNGGFFKTGASGVDYSQQNAAQYALSGLTSAGAGAVILTASAATDMVGNGIHIISGTNFTAGWYEITAVSAGVSITVDRNCTSGVGATGVANVGGAMSLANSDDDAVFENAVIGNKFYIKQGTYALGGTVNISVNGNATSGILVEGYAVTRGDRPTGSTRPLINTAAANFAAGGISWIWRSIQFTGTASIMLNLGGASQAIDCKFTNTSATADRTAVELTTDASLIRCEVVCYRGLAVNGNGNASLFGCYIHDSKKGMELLGTTIGFHAINCIFENCWSVAVSCAVGLTGTQILFGNTFYGGNASKIGTGIMLAAGATDFRVINNIITGFVTGINVADAVGNNIVSYDGFNCFYNNTANATNWTIDSTSITTDPGLTGVSQINGTAGTTASSILTDAAANFTNVVANQDFVYLVSGTGITAGVYLITAKTTTTLTLSPAPGNDATADKVYHLTTGHVFTPGANAKSVGFPGAYPGGFTTSYVDIGATQTQYGLGVAPGGSSKRNNLGPVRLG